MVARGIGDGMRVVRVSLNYTLLMEGVIGAFSNTHPISHKASTLR